jgi:hypothetical protein
MTKLSIRLDRIEEAITPKERMALCFGRWGKIDEDCKRQHEEFKALHGERGKVTFIHIQDYGRYKDDEEGYEDFIKRRRKATGKGNCFCWWPELPEDEKDCKEAK